MDVSDTLSRAKGCVPSLKIVFLFMFSLQNRILQILLWLFWFILNQLFPSVSVPSGKHFFLTTFGEYLLVIKEKSSCITTNEQHDICHFLQIRVEIFQ